MNTPRMTPFDQPSDWLDAQHLLSDLNSAQASIARFIYKTNTSNEHVNTRLGCIAGFKPDNRLKCNHKAPDWWLQKAMNSEFTNIRDQNMLTAISNAFVTGGSINKRWLKIEEYPQFSFHEGSQGVFMQDGSIADPESFLIMDGGKSLPYIYFANENASDDSRLESLRRRSKRVEGNTFFMGCCHNHFGHFLIEFLPRLWILPKLDRSFIKSCTFVIPGKSVNSWMQELITPILQAYDIENVLYIDNEEVLLCERAWMSSLSYISHRGFTSQVGPFFDNLYQIFRGAYLCTSNQSSLDSRIFLSRGKSHLRRCLQQSQVEDMYRKSGYLIVYPEELGVAEQINAVSSATHIAGFAGSATYLSLFAQELQSLSIVAPRNFLLADDYLIADIRDAVLNLFLGGEMDFADGMNSGDWSVELGGLQEFLTKCSQ